ncbi:hydroxypyruvate reductase [Raphidocelis subcapitata]|uniref:Hydroxypyruvate reductase n=1 Tax=Raphidocelis subcapitata TaxID=307507 RepID=A0A2V0P756_9CHLO|nr:hydroxypyruvate reductase [Raphidocelis subcapitata]|eukprot:GBF93680.1 hydroxypyruvate reductase [Raphidocelis subcapitata]
MQRTITQRCSGAGSQTGRPFAAAAAAAAAAPRMAQRRRGPQQEQRLGGSRDVAASSTGGSGKAAPSLKHAAAQGGSDPVYVAAAQYLKLVGLNNQAELARVLDIAMNPNSLFVQYNDPKRSRNASARELSVEADMAPVIDFLTARGLTKSDVVAVVTGHPPVLSYSVPGRLEPFWEFMGATVGLPDVGAAVVKRPSLLGLNLDSLDKIVGYLKSVDTPPETIIQYMLTSI